MYRRKRAGPKTDPCGTPDVTGTLSALSLALPLTSSDAFVS